MAGFDPAHIKAYFPMLVKVTERFARRWQRAAASGHGSGEAIDLQADLMRYTVDVTASLAFGADINTIESKEDVALLLPPTSRQRPSRREQRSRLSPILQEFGTLRGDINSPLSRDE
jgi:cytochrome P450